MPDTVERRVVVEPPYRTAGGPGESFVSVYFTFFGIASLLVAGAVLSSVLDYVGKTPLGSAARNGVNLPIGFCVLLMTIGLGFSAWGLWGLAIRFRAARLAAAHPNEPWFKDFAWKPEGQRERPLGSIMGSLLGLLLPCLLALPFNVWAFGFGGPAALVALVVVLDALLLVPVAQIGVRAARKIRYGGVFIRYDRFPFFLGGRLDATVGSSRLPRSGVPITVTLRFIEERLAQGSRRVNTHYQLYADEQSVDSGGSSPDRGVRVSFPLPSGDYATALAATYQRFWQLHLHAVTDGLDFDESLVVPVYGPPGPAEWKG